MDYDRDRPLKICFIQPFIYRVPRGLERYCIHLANELAKLGHSVTIMTWAELNGSTASHLNSNVRVVKVPYFRYYRSLVAVPFYTFEVLTKKFDFVNIFFAGYGEAEAIAITRKFRKYTTVFIAGYPIEQVPDRFQEFRKWGLDQNINKIIVKSTKMSHSISTYFQREVDILYNGIDLELFDPEKVSSQTLRERHNVQEDDTVLLTIAALEERKGIQHVIKVLPILIQAGNSIHYFIVGDGPYRADLEDLVMSLNLAEYVHFVGYITEVRPYYKLADIFLLLSYGESFGNVLLEAWAMKVPVIVSKHPPFNELVKAEVGLSVNEENLYELEDALNLLLGSSEYRQRLGENGRLYVTKEFSWPMIVLRYLETLQG